MKMRKVVIIVAALCLVSVGGLAIWIMNLDPKEITALVERKAEQATGRKLQIDGSIKLKFSLIPTLSIDGLRLQNASWGSQPDMLSVKHAEVQLALLPLFHRQVELRKIVFVEPQMLLEVNAKGDKNWVFHTADKTQNPEQRNLTIDIAELRVEQALLVYRPASPAQPQTVRIEVLSMKASDSDKANIDTKVTINDVPVQLAGVIPNFGHLAAQPGAINASIDAPIDIKIVSNGAMLTLAGQISAGTQNASPSESANLRFTAQADDPSAFAKQFKIELPHLPKTQLEGHISVAKSMLTFELEKAQVGRSNMRAQLHMPLGSGRRNISFNIDSPLLDMREMFGAIAPAKTKKAVSANGRLFSDDALPLKNLSAFDVAGNIKVASLVLRDGRSLQALTAKVDLRRGKLLVDPLSLSVDGKPLRAKIQADVSDSHTVSIDMSLEGKDIALSALAGLANVAAAPEGALTDVSIHYSGRGASIRQLAASANGDVRFVVGPGRWKGKAFDVGEDITEVFKAIMPTSAVGDYTELQCAVVRFPIKQGVAHIENGIGIETTKVKVLATGVVDLRSETLNLGFHPKAGTGLGVGIGNLAQLVRVGGTLSKPGVEVDPVGAATTVVELGLAGYTGGASLLAQRLFSGKSIDHPCETALGKGSSTKAESAKPETPAPGKTIDKSLPENAADALRRLFGGQR